MKAFLGALCATLLLLTVAGGAMASAHPPMGWYGDFTYTNEIEWMSDMYTVFLHDNLFSVGETTPGFFVGLATDDDFEGGLLNAGYLQNDQCFALLNYGLGEADFFTILRGSYLFDFGLFAGATFAFEEGEYYGMISPGYRLDLGDGGYVAFSLDYEVSSMGGNGIYGYEVDAKYLADNLKVTGQLYLDDDGDFFIYGKGNYALSDELTIGGGLFYAEYGSMFFGGLTWKPGSFTVDALVSVDDGDFGYILSGIIDITDSLALGLEYNDYMEETIAVKAEFAIGDAELAASYAMDTDGDVGIFYLDCSWAL